MRKLIYSKNFNTCREDNFKNIKGELMTLKNKHWGNHRLNPGVMGEQKKDKRTQGIKQKCKKLRGWLSTRIEERRR
ncbi:hypothetical protein ATANTOWER_028187 [Ataeniobius toweri]|uniref:Uncharacterized protein n=1 Tax=Ataeniobius toweri TaxID=208326 RepID=A0ABU7ATX8_9TELE|nr:hypothetical protein [Ataeniobius toweri]